MPKLPNNQQGYKKLVVYQKSKELVLLIYKLTKTYPKEELYVLSPQMRRCTLSILANIVEGYSKSSRKEFARFLDISIGSAAELDVFLDISYELNYINDEAFEKSYNLLIEVKKLLYSFQKTLRLRHAE